MESKIEVELQLEKGNWRESASEMIGVVSNNAMKEGLHFVV